MSAQPLAAYEHTVGFGEVDAAGVVFFARYFEYAHAAWEAVLLRAYGRRWFDLIRGEGWGLPLINARAEFRRPARLGDLLRIPVLLAERTERTLKLELRVEGEGEITHAVVEHEHAFVDIEQFRLIDARPELFERLAQLGLEAPG